MTNGSLPKRSSCTSLRPSPSESGSGNALARTVCVEFAPSRVGLTQTLQMSAESRTVIDTWGKVASRRMGMIVYDTLIPRLVIDRKSTLQ